MPLYTHENIIDDNHLQVFFAAPFNENCICPAHCHNHLEIILIISGTMVAYINSQKYLLGPSDMLVINSNDIHSTFINDSITYILLQIPADFISRTLPNYSLIHFQEHYPSSNRNVPYTCLRNYLLDMKKDYEEKEDGFELHFTAILYQFLFCLYKNFSMSLSSTENAKNNRDIKRIEDVIRYVRLHYTEPITLSDTAASVCLSREYFCRLFKEYTGQTFLEYLNTYRIVRFYSDLVQTTYSITYLLEKNGITNYKVFMNLFKKTYHATPKQIRQLNQSVCTISSSEGNRNHIFT